MTKKIDISALPRKIGTLYPPPYSEKSLHREKKALGDAAGLTQFGVNLTRLPAGTWSSLPHWHVQEDEFVYILEGEAVLVCGDTEETLRPGDCAGFKAGEEVGHCIQNRSDRDVVLLEIGTRSKGEKAYYPGVDLMADLSKPEFYFHLDGTPYPDVRRRSPDNP